MSLFRVQGPVQAASGAQWWEACDFKVCTSLAALDEYLAPIFDSGTPFGSDFESTSLNVWPGKRTDPPVQIVDWIVSRGPDSARLVPINHLKDYQYNLPQGAILERLQRLDEAKIPGIWHNFKYDGELSRFVFGWVPEHWEDVYFSIWLLDCSQHTFGLKDASQRVMGRKMLEIEQVLNGAPTFAHLSPFDPLVVPYGCSDASQARMLHFHPAVKAARERQSAIYTIEKQFLPGMLDAIRNASPLDPGAIARVDGALGGADKVKSKLVKPYSGLTKLYRDRALAALGKDDSFNIGARAQLGQALVDAGVPIEERTAGKKPQISTSKKVIAHYGQAINEATGELRYPVVNDVIKIGELLALHNNYVRKLQRAFDHFGSWVRFPFGQLGAPTGRMNSGGEGTDEEAFSKGVVDLNVQSMPKGDDEDEFKELDVRSVVCAYDPSDPEAAEWELVSIDFSGFQLRIAANYSREPVWVNAFLLDKNMHLETARGIYGAHAQKETTEYNRGKTGNFTVLFGGHATTIARAFRIPVKEAEAWFEKYWRALPYLKNWIDQTHAHARREGTVRTIFGRERPLQAYYGGAERWMHLKGDREAVSHIIQGSEADLFKVACIRARKTILSHGWQDLVKVMLFIHDALVFRVHRSVRDVAIREIVRVMEGTAVEGWPVPLKVDAKIGRNWGKTAVDYPIERPKKIIVPATVASVRERPAAIPAVVALPARPSSFRAG